MEDIKKMIQIEIIKRDIPSMAWVAEKCGWQKQALSQRLTSKSMRVRDLEKVANAMGCDLEIKFVDKD